MNQVLLFLHLAIMAVAGLGATVRAQETPESGLYFDVVYWGSWMDRPLKFKSGKDLKVIPLQAGRPSAYVYNGPSPLVFYREESADPKTGELMPVPVLSVNFDPSCKRAVLLVIPDPANPDKLKANFIPLLEKDFPPGTALLMNGTRKPLKSRLAGDSFTLEPRQRRLAAMPAGSSVPMVTAAEWRGKLMVMHTDSFTPSEGERRLIFFYTPAQSESVITFVSVIPPDHMRYTAEGQPLESESVDPDFKPSKDPTGMSPYIPEP